MDPQISLEDAFSCFIAGKAMSDVEYKRNQRKIARKVSKSPEYGFRAGKEWDFDRFRPYSFIITEGVSKSVHVIIGCPPVEPQRNLTENSSELRQAA